MQESITNIVEEVAKELSEKLDKDCEKELAEYLRFREIPHSANRTAKLIMGFFKEYFTKQQEDKPEDIRMDRTENWRPCCGEPTAVGGHQPHCQLLNKDKPQYIDILGDVSFCVKNSNQKFSYLKRKQDEIIGHVNWLLKNK